jgi:hypothetical protein
MDLTPRNVHEVKRNPGRPPKEPETPFVTLTLRIPAELKLLLMSKARAFDMTLTEYLTMLVERDGS